MQPIKAICVLQNNSINGIILLTEDLQNKTTKIDVNITGLTSGKHGFHIHQSGDTRKGCESMGPHYNPFKKDHGGLNTKIRHIGDLGNLVAKDSYVKTTIISKSIKLRGKYSVLGRSIVIHADEDDLGKGNHSDSKTTGHSGARVVCGIIALLE